MTKKAIFDSKQPSVQIFTVDGKTTVQICLNEVEETVTSAEDGNQTVQYSYDFNEFTDKTDSIDIDAIKADPSAYLEYQPAADPTAEERLSELEQAVQDLAMVTVGE